MSKCQKCTQKEIEEKLEKCECCGKSIQPKPNPYKWDRKDKIRMQKSNKRKSLERAGLARELGGEFMSAAYF